MRSKRVFCAWAAAGATWWLVGLFDWRKTSVDEVRGVIADGPPTEA